MIRRDLGTVRDLATPTANGDASPSEVREGIDALKTHGPLWKLRINCLRYCRFVHSHHNAEDAMLFPALRAANPEHEPVVDRLEADHRRISDLLDAVVDSAGALAEEAGGEQRQASPPRLMTLPTTCSSISSSRKRTSPRRWRR
jgi:hypothetical protein